MTLEEFDLLRQGYSKRFDHYYLSTGYGQARRSILVGFYDNGMINYREHYKLASWDRDPELGPALEIFERAGPLCKRLFYHNGEFTRRPDDGPAVEVFALDGTCIRREYWYKGVLVSKEI